MLVDRGERDVDEGVEFDADRGDACVCCFVEAWVFCFCWLLRGIREIEGGRTDLDIEADIVWHLD